VTFTKPKVGLKLLGTRRGLVVQGFTPDFDGGPGAPGELVQVRRCAPGTTAMNKLRVRALGKARTLGRDRARIELSPFLGTEGESCARRVCPFVFATIRCLVINGG
jgi:hypothetical protein